MLPGPGAVNGKADYELAARQVMDYIDRAFYISDQGLYTHSLKHRHPEFMWGNGVIFTALLGGARHDPDRYSPSVRRFFESMDRYWDGGVEIPGYEPAPTRGGGNDKYYDDNAWMVLGFVEAYELTRDKRFLNRAQQTLDFVLSGWDQRLGGGIWWHQGHKDGTKNTCVNAPAAVACLRIAKHLPPDKGKSTVMMAKKLVDWTNENLRLDDGLYGDRIYVDSGRVVDHKLTYNTGLMIRALHGLYLETSDQAYLDQARRSMKAANWFLDEKTQAYRDPPKWSHLLVEADLEMYRATKEPYLLQRAINNADYQYASWKSYPPDSLIDNAAIARMLWLVLNAQAQRLK
jgi:uncharacterized protein YyaL (SSP411 family)